MSRSFRLLLMSLLAAVLAAGGCNRDKKSEPDPTGAKPTEGELPPLELREDTPNLLLTWIDKKGDFHVVQNVGAVPDDARKEVRVVVTTNPNGTGKLVYVADLSHKNSDGTYPIKTMTRAAWDEKGASKRKARLEALAPPAPSGSGAPGGSADVGMGANADIVAIIYGAEWCGPCHDAARYLKARGVKVIEKDIEANPLAAQEMKDKLDRVGRAGSSIPVIDVMGQVLIGFSPRALDRAVEAAKNTTTL